MIDLLYKRDGQTRFYFVNQICSKNFFLCHLITAPLQTLVTATKHGRRKIFLQILQNPRRNNDSGASFQYSSRSATLFKARLSRRCFNACCLHGKGNLM